MVLRMGVSPSGQVVYESVSVPASEKPCWLIGVDLGRPHERTALAVVERVPGKGEHLLDVNTGRVEDREVPVAYHVRHLERFAIGATYLEIIARIQALCTSNPLQDPQLLIDVTSVGTRVLQMIKPQLNQPDSRVHGVSIVASGSETHDAGNYTVPKRDLVGILQMLLQTNCLKVASELPDATILTREWRNFKMRAVTLNPEDEITWRESADDDLVLAVALACWWGEAHLTQTPCVAFAMVHDFDWS